MRMETAGAMKKFYQTDEANYKLILNLIIDKVCDEKILEYAKLVLPAFKATDLKQLKKYCKNKVQEEIPEILDLMLTRQRAAKLNLDEIIKLSLQTKDSSTVNLVKELFKTLELPSLEMEVLEEENFTPENIIDMDITELSGEFISLTPDTKTIRCDFMIVINGVKHIVEIQTIYTNMVIRLMQYGLAEASKSATQDQETKVVKLVFPKLGAIFLEETNAPEKHMCEIELPDGYVHKFEIPTMNYWEYSKEDLVKLGIYNLLCILPLHLVPEMETAHKKNDVVKLNELEKKFREMCNDIIQTYVELNQSKQMTDASCSQYVDNLINLSTTIAEKFYVNKGKEMVNSLVGQYRHYTREFISEMIGEDGYEAWAKWQKELEERKRVEKMLTIKEKQNEVLKKDNQEFWEQAEAARKQSEEARKQSEQFQEKLVVMLLKEYQGHPNYLELIVEEVGCTKEKVLEIQAKHKL